ncbi:uncharacterized protein [Argopecten irradians]|uniref:uncharacterized protein n=1 Tax=Argopecten irradians TaxID=31199 RepID=UPI00371D074C
MGRDFSLLRGVLTLLLIQSSVSVVRFNVKIKTGTRSHAGTSARVYIDVEGTTGNANSVYLGNDFQNGETKYADIYIDVGRVNAITVYHDNSRDHPGWDLEYIEMWDIPALLKYTFVCNCWVEKGDRRRRSSKECYYYKAIAHCSSTPVRVQCHIGRCTRCEDGYFIDGNTCSSCGRINDCSTTLCNNMADRWCTKCRDIDLFKLGNGGRSCERTCSWEDRWCWPGTCGSPDTHNYARNCTCDSTDFRRVYSATQAKCELAKPPEVITCRMKIIDQHNDERMSMVTPGQPNHCSNQQDFYGNIQVKHVDTSTTFDLLVNVSHLNSQKPHFVTDYAFGITDVHFIIVKKTTSDSETIKKIPIKEDPDSNNILTPVSFDRTLNNAFSLENGQRLCLRYVIKGGGHMISMNVQNNSTHPVPYPKTSSTRELCYWYDNAPPEHCFEHSACGTEPLDTTSRILTSRDFIVTFTGWDDPSPVPGNSKFSSGIHTYVINMYEVKESGSDFLSVARIPVIPAVQTEKISPVNISIPSNLPNPAMYAIVLEVTDIAKNVRQARRFVMFDNSSTVTSRDDNPFYSTTASQKTNHKWQTNLGQICYSWTNKYYNDKFHTLNLLKPIRNDPHGLISGVYDQTTGILPVSGTENIHGITRFYYTLRRDGKIINNTDVPDFTSQKLCVSPKLTDGNTYRLDLLAEDVMTHTYTDSLVTYIDSSEPEIFDIWLEKDGYERLFVHNSIDLSKMILTFEASDIHSGIHSVDWSLGTIFGGNDIGQGSIGVQRLGPNITCPDAVLTCYCPSVGVCSFNNFTLHLNSLVHNHTHKGNHNRQYHFTITVTNIAQLISVEHLEILADDSPPTPGVVMEGTVGSPDIDYTSNEIVTVNWAGFFDHESGIKLYKVGLSRECLDIAEFGRSNDNITNKGISVLETALTSARLSLPEDGKFYVTVVAYNNAMEPSKPVCSDGIVLDRTKPKLVNFTLQSATMRETILCSDGSAWFITANLTKHEIRDIECNEKCQNSTTNDFVSSLPRDIPDMKHDLTPTCNISALHGTIYLPIDLINLKWNIIEGESQTHEAFFGIGSTKDCGSSPDVIGYQKTNHKYFYKKRHTGLSNGDEFYIFIKLPTVPALISQCIKIPLYPHQTLFTCVELYCPLGTSGLQCVPLTVSEDPNSFDKTALYEVDSDSDVVREIRNFIHASNLGKRLASLHEAELDFSAKPVRVGGIILGLEDRQVTWYLLKDKMNQSFTCDDNPPVCVTVHQTVGGFCPFQGIVLENEIIHYICAEIESYTTPNGQILPAFQTCGDGFVFDENPPEKGDVIIISQNGYITNNRHMLVHWDGFKDFHGYKDLGYPDSISRYEYSIGSNPYGEDVVARKTIGHSNSVKIISPNLHPGSTYYATVTAFDHVGHSSTVVSPGVLYDDTPPVRGSLHVGTYLMSKDFIESEVHVHWTGFDDDDSGIDRIQVGIGSTKSETDIVSFRNFSGKCAIFTDLSHYHDGHDYYAIILVTNKAGLSVLSASESFVIDKSPPTKGTVQDGVDVQSPDIDFQANTTHAGCHWSGFSDPHSGVLYYTAGLGTQPSEDDVRTMTSTGTQTAIRWQHTLVPGAQYFCTVQACNGAGLCTSVSSNGFTTDTSPPVPGVVHVGIDGHHSRYWPHPDTIQAQWFGFSDVESGIRRYEVCIRSY